MVNGTLTVTMADNLCIMNSMINQNTGLFFAWKTRKMYSIINDEFDV